MPPSEVLYRLLADIDRTYEYRSPTGISCAACSELTRIESMTKAEIIVSSEFTNWDDFSGELLCPSCSWLYTSKQIRSLRVIVYKPSDEKEYISPISSQRIFYLKSTGIPFSILVSFSGRKQLAPLMQWGQLTWDRETFPWTDTHTLLLKEFVFLKNIGLQDSDFHNEICPVPPISKMSIKDIKRFFAAWEMVQKISKRSDGMIDLMLVLSQYKAGVEDERHS